MSTSTPIPPSDLATTNLKSSAEKNTDLSRPDRMSRDYWLTQSLSWGGLSILFVATSAFGDLESAVRYAIAKTFAMATGFLLSHVWYGWLRKHGWLDGDRSIPFHGIAAWLLMMSLIQTGLVLFIDTLVNRSNLLRDEHLFVTLAGITFLWFTLFLVWTLIYAVALSRRRATRFELEKLQLEVNVKEAELRTLQAQINPHFFFNSLNSIRALIYEDREAAANAVNQLASMMRYSLKAGQSHTAKLSDELNAVQAYLQMEKLRFEKRMQLSFEVESGLEDVRMPTLVLQTLVENAIKHGVERSVGSCQVRITAKREREMVVISVANQGHLHDSSSSTQLGLANAAKRLSLLFGSAASLNLSEEDGWVIARISLPRD